MKRLIIAATLLGLALVLGCAKEESEKRGAEKSEAEKSEAEKSEAVAVAESLDHLATTDAFEPFDAPPSVIESAPPEYPEEAKSQGLEGTVRVRVVVGVDGLVESVAVVESTAKPILEQAALETAKKYRFNPATRDGDPVRSTVVVPFRYKLNGNG